MSVMYRMAVSLLFVSCATVPPETTEEFARKAIAKAMKQLQREVYVCSTVQERHEPQLSGKMTVRMSIAPSGMATNLQISPPTFQPTELAACVTRVVTEYKFPNFEFPDPIEVDLSVVAKGSCAMREEGSKAPCL